MVPRGLCVYCGHDRPSASPAAPCRDCHHTAEEVHWWCREAQHGDATWRFATADGAWSGRVYILYGRTCLGWGAQVDARAVEVPPYASAITSAGVRAAGLGALGPSVSLVFGEGDEDDASPLAEAKSFAPILAAALVGMAARDSCRLQRLIGWQRTLTSRAPVAPYERLALAPGLTFDEPLWLERTTLDILADLRREDVAAWNATAREEPTAHYRTRVPREFAHGCTLRDLARRFQFRDDFHAMSIGQVKRDLHRANESAMAFRTFAAAQPAVVQQILESLQREV